MPLLLSSQCAPSNDKGLKQPSVGIVNIQEDAAATYRASHSNVLTDLYDSDQPNPPSDRIPVLGGLGGIVVPTSRGFLHTKDSLRSIARIAFRHGCPMVNLQSHDAQAEKCVAGLENLLQDSAATLINVNINDVHPSWQPSFDSAVHELTKPHRASNLAWKRTLGQMLAMRLGWEFILFVDDDITPAVDGSRTLSPDDLSHALYAMQEHRDLQIVGWPSLDFPDNSVVGHARRLIGFRQDVFISGSAMLLRVTEHMSFFPLSMYNEDWLMMIGTVAGAPNAKGALARGGRVKQRPYDPFRVPRAQCEEVGELLGEGLMNLLEDEGAKALPTRMDAAYWKRVIVERRALLEDIIDACEGRAASSRSSEQALCSKVVVQCMRAALRAQKEVSAQALASYATQWWQDHKRWRAILRSLTEAASAVHVPVEDVARILQQPPPCGQHPDFDADSAHSYFTVFAH